MTDTPRSEPLTPLRSIAAYCEARMTEGDPDPGYRTIHAFALQALAARQPAADTSGLLDAIDREIAGTENLSRETGRSVDDTFRLAGMRTIRRIVAEHRPADTSGLRAALEAIRDICKPMSFDMSGRAIWFEGGTPAGGGSRERIWRICDEALSGATPEATAPGLTDAIDLVLLRDSEGDYGTNMGDALDALRSAWLTEQQGSGRETAT